MCGAARPSPRPVWASLPWPIRYAALALAAVLLLPVLLTALYRVVPPPGTPLMAIRALAGDEARH